MKPTALDNANGVNVDGLPVLSPTSLPFVGWIPELLEVVTGVNLNSLDPNATLTVGERLQRAFFVGLEILPVGDFVESAAQGASHLARRTKTLVTGAARQADDAADGVRIVARHGDDAASLGRRSSRRVSVPDVRPTGGFGAKGLYTPPTGMADDAVKAAYLKEVNSLAFRVKLRIHNLLTPFHKRTSVSAIREAVENGAFGRGAFTVKRLEDGRMLFGGSPTRTFLNRQFFHHELIHASQMLKNPKLWTEFPFRMLHEPIQLWTAHGTWGIPATILTGWWFLESTDGD